MPLTHLGLRWKLRTPGPFPRPRYPQPVTREKKYFFELGPRRYCLSWRPWWGLWFVGSMPVSDEVLCSIYAGPHNGGKVLKRIAPVSADSVVRPPLSHETVVLKKFPQTVAFLVDTAYDDGSPRTPGGFWWNNLGTGFEVVLRNPDAGARLPLLAPTIDEMWAACEMVLRADNAPWQPDKWLMEQLLKKGKKK